MPTTLNFRLFGKWIDRHYHDERLTYENRVALVTLLEAIDQCPDSFKDEAWDDEMVELVSELWLISADKLREALSGGGGADA